MQQPDLQHFEIFLAVAEHMSFTAAAKHLGVSKAAVSQTIRQLESNLKVPLFIRSTRKISLTDEGALLLQQCQRLKIELDAARHLLSRFEEQPSGTLRVSCNPYLAQQKLIPIIKAYQQNFPNVTLDLLLEERMPDMVKEQVDIVFGITWRAPEDVVARPIDRIRYVLCASPNYLKQFGVPKSLADLKTHRYIPHAARDPQTLIVSLKQPRQLNLETPLLVNNAEFMKRCALADLGIIQLHDYMVAEELKSGTLVEILRDQLQPEVNLYIYYQKHRFVQPKIRQFINLVLADHS